MTIKIDCFGYKFGQCNTLNEMLCKTGKCPFYKSVKQFDRGMERYRVKV